jgi:hypothetical protein
MGEVVAQVNTNLPFFDVKTESQQIDRLLFQELPPRSRVNCSARSAETACKTLLLPSGRIRRAAECHLWSWRRADPSSGESYIASGILQNSRNAYFWNLRGFRRILETDARGRKRLVAITAACYDAPG